MRKSLNMYGIIVGLIILIFVATPRNSTAVGGVEGTFEYAFDAPWRMEPDKQMQYGAIPIQISIHDAMFAGLDNDPAGVPTTLGDFISVTVREPGFERTYALKDLAEIEMTKGAWPWPTASTPPTHHLHRAWAGDANPEPFRDLSQTSEWHALLWYEPRQSTPGFLLPLEIEVELKQPYPGGRVVLRNHVRVYFGDAPLPRFGNRWLYGDLHYHSQGTDNEGESGYSYRGVIRAMGAMGLDFLFATEHASDSEQIIDLDVNADIDYNPTSGGLLGVEVGLQDITPTGGVLRDMSKERFRFNHGLIWGRNGVNREAAINAAPYGAASGNRLPQGYLSHGVVPQIFLGGEVDVIPEVPARGPSIPYGNGRSYDVLNLCGGYIVGFEGRRVEIEGTADRCHFNDLFEEVEGGYLLRDVQGINDFDYGREHLVYFPKDSALEVSVCNEEFCWLDSSFISSSTGPYGGASRRLAEPHPWPIGARPMLSEIEQKGYTFLAHHLNASEGSAGPEGPPWSRAMLEKAWKSPAVLGLEFWNEDTRFTLDIDDWHAAGDGYAGEESGYERCENLDYWQELCDAFPNNQVRDGFKSSPASFELIPYDPITGGWGEQTLSVERTLHHGAADWDLMNYWGLDVNLTSGLAWLKDGEPRRVFMAGGSDAHGDLNYRRAGYFLGTTEINDTAMGKPRNLVLMGPREPVVRINPNSVNPPYTQAEIIEALRQGRFLVTDGPALRIGIDQNSNDKIDDPDTQMGGIVRLYSDGVPLYGNDSVTLLVEWISTPEFGPVKKIDLYVGTRTSREIIDPDETEHGRTYAPEWHGTRDIATDPPSVSAGGYPSTNGRFYRKMGDGYWLDPTGNLRVTLSPGDPEAYAGTRAIALDLEVFEAMRNVPGDRFFFRAFAETHAARSAPHYAFTNPIWVIRQSRFVPVDPIDPHIP